MPRDRRFESVGGRSYTLAAVEDLGRVRLELENLRRDGIPFDDAWRTAISSLPAASGREDLNGGRAITAWALEPTKSEWHAAYERRPTVPWVDAVGRLAPPL
jgi:hypothetical protein